jgi:hypothetical protein
MNMTRQELKVGCQTFTWEMLGDRFAGGPDGLIEAIAGGFGEDQSRNHA